MRLDSVCAIAFVLHSLLLVVVSAKKSTYIVQMKHNHKPASYNTQSEWYSDHFESLTSATRDSILYTYEEAYMGFAAIMSPEEVESHRMSDFVVGVHEDTLYNLHTTHTPEFLGLNDHHLWPGLGHTPEELNEASEDVIIGVVDTGVWPESPSFRDHGMTTVVPARWLGKCEFPNDDHFRPESKMYCNEKLIGARFFDRGFNAATGSIEPHSTRDSNGHGTHTASTAAGSRVANASLFGYAQGNARGMAYRCRVAAYKACWGDICYGSDILAAIESAISDGVDVLSISVGGLPGTDYAGDPVAIAAFAAVEKGIFVSCSAGNSGPNEGSVVNVAPWIMTVGAGTIDRDFPSFATLGNRKKYTGVSLYSGKGMGRKSVGLVYGVGNSSSNLCLPGSLDATRVREKVVLCDRGVIARVEKGAVVKDAGGFGMILANTEESGGELVADSHFLPAVAVGSGAGNMIRKYVMSAKHPKALLTFGGTKLNVKPAPVVSAFSSRGPNTVTPQILKPDVIGPGVNILAGWSEAVAPTGLPMDKRRTKFNIISGTSMSCPHISGLAALVKAAHPEWSPSAIKSALMTTAYTLDNTNSSIRDVANNTAANPWAYGAGHVNPLKALSPGLVYDATTKDYIAFLCYNNFTIDMIRAITKQKHITCARKFRDAGQLNYPSFSVVFGKSRVVRYTRVLTNVDAQKSVYWVYVDAPPNVVVTVKPSKLVFENVGDKQRYTVTFVSQLKGVSPHTYSFGSINWRKAKKQVNSPVAFMWT